jgi:hypothetical protein
MKRGDDDRSEAHLLLFLFTLVTWQSDKLLILLSLSCRHFRIAASQLKFCGDGDGNGDRKWMESDGVVDRWMRKRRGAEEDARGDGSSIGVMELGPEFVGRNWGCARH